MRWFYLWLSFLSLFALGLADNSRGPVFPDLLRDFELSDSRGALFFFVTSAFSLGNNLLATWWLPRWGAYRSIQIYLAAQALGLLLMGLASTYAGVLAGAALFGIGIGGLGIAQNALVGRASSGAGRGRAYSFLHCMYGAASLLAPPLASALFRAGFAWQTVLLWMTVPTVGCWLATWARKPLVGDRGVRGPRARLGSARGAALWTAFAFALYVMSELLISTRIVLLARREYGLDVTAANDRLTLFFILLFLGRMIFVVVPSKFLSPIKVMRVSALVSALIFGLGLFFGPTWLALAGLSMAPFFPLGMTYLQERFGVASDATIGWTLTFSSLLTMVMHQAVGFATDWVGLSTAMVIGPLALSICFAILLYQGAESASRRNEIG